MMSLQGESPLNLVEILDRVSRPIGSGALLLIAFAQAFEAPSTSLDLRRQSVRTLQGACSWRVCVRLERKI